MQKKFHVITLLLRLLSANCESININTSSTLSQGQGKIHAVPQAGNKKGATEVTPFCSKNCDVA
jgi:hypothetical protein